MSENDADQTVVSKFLAQNIAENFLFPMIERQRAHNLRCIIAAAISFVAMVLSIYYGASLRYGDTSPWHVIVFFLAFLVFFSAVPIGVYGWFQRHHLESLLLLMNKIIIKNS